MEIAEYVLGIITPALALFAFLTPIMGRIFKKEIAPFLSALVATLIATLASTLVFYFVATMGTPIVYKYGGWPPHFGIVYEVDLLNALIGLFTTWTLLTIVLYSHWYSRHLDNPVLYYTLLIGLEIGLLGCLYTGDAFNLFVMIEVLSISAYALVAYHRDSPVAVEAAAKYALIGATATTLYFLAVVLIYAGFGSVNMAVLAAYSRQYRDSPILMYISIFSIALALWVFTYKSALFPNHFWLPDAHPEAPTPVSAALSGLVVNVGIYACSRFLYTMFGAESAASGYREIILTILFVLGAISGIVGALMMMIQRDIKRLLAYSTICHMGIIYMGISAGFLIGSEEACKVAIMGAVVHIIGHGIAKALLFMASGVFIDATGSRDLDEMRGIGRYCPLTSLSLIFGFLSLAGFIPFIGFYSKLFIALGYLNAGLAVGPVLIIIISALTIPGYLKAISALIFATGKEPRQMVTNKWVEVLLFTMAISLLLLGVLFQYTLPVFTNAAESLASQRGILEYINEAFKKIPDILRHYLGG